MIKKTVLILSLISRFAAAHAEEAKTVAVISQEDVKVSAVAGETSSAESESPAVLSFIEWKSMRVHEAQRKLEQMGKAPGQAWQEGSPRPNLENPSTDPQKLNFNVDVALQSNIQDYFSMYLKTLSPEAFKEATKKLTTDEVSELLLAYKNFQDKDLASPAKVTKSLKKEEKSKNSKVQ